MAVFIGFAGDLIYRRELRDIYGTKVGGAPVTPWSFDEAVFNDAQCGVCSSQLALVLQTHAPLSETQIGRSLPHRWLYVFGCVQKGCGNDSKCWRVFRLQSHSQSLMKDAVIVNDVSAIESEKKIDSIEIGHELEEKSQETFSLEGFKMALEASSKGKFKKASQKRPTAVEMEEGIEHVWAIQLPKFHIYSERETQRHSPPSDDIDKDQIQASLAVYSSHADNDGWLEEDYEKSHPHPSDRAFQKFQKKLELSPKQCARYGFNGVYLNPVATVIDPPVCSCCGSRRVFELQLMPHLITALYESGQCLRADADVLDLGRYENAVQCFMEWDWMTVTVFSCLGSCQGNDLQEYICLVRH